MSYREHRQSGYIEATDHAESMAYSRKYAARRGGFIHTAQRLPEGRYEVAGTVMGVRGLRINWLGLRHGVRGAEGTRLQRAPKGAASQGAQSYLSRRVLMGTQYIVY